MHLFSSDIFEDFSYQELIDYLKDSLPIITSPDRLHYQYANKSLSEDNTLLLMPSFESDGMLGVKTVIVAPQNRINDLPSINGIYNLFDSKTGIPIAGFDAKKLTAIRTAATSALLSSLLSREDSSCLLIVGTGALTTEFIKAHSSQRKFDSILIWGRDIKKAQALAQSLSQSYGNIEAISNLQKGVEKAHIISTLTMSTSPLIKGDWLQAGQHLDLVGSYKRNMREVDDQCILQSKLYVDTVSGACNESGDLFDPISRDIISKSDIIGDMFDLLRGIIKGRISNKEITLFKSVGHASEDLAASCYFYNKATIHDKY